MAAAPGGSTWRQAYLDPGDQNPMGEPTPTGNYYHSSGLENTSCWQVFWSDTDHIFACYSDIRGIRSTDGGESWSFDYSGHTQNSMYRIEQHPVNGTLYAATSTVHDIYQSTYLKDNRLDNGDGKIIYSQDQGATWIDLHDFGMPVFWLALDPNDSNTMYASVINYAQGLGGIYVCHNLQDLESSIWTQLSVPPRTEGHPATIVVLDDGLVLCTFSGRREPSGSFTASSGTFIYDPVSGGWDDVSDPGMFYWTKDIVVDPHDADQNTWYVAVFSGWGGPPNGLGGLYKTTNRGDSWTRISDLDRVTSCTLHPDNSNEMYLTTEADGLWRSINIDQSSPTFSIVENYPFRQPERIFFNPHNNNTPELWVTSFGNGLAVATEFYIAPGDANNDGWITIADIALTINAILGNVSLTHPQTQGADANQDGILTIQDIIEIVDLIPDD
ncbi:MAG: hypothetical protein GY869_19950 [Planctomycetes bacterium]|nr:hypothetical protein [Planctomycetota bacterium]